MTEYIDWAVGQGFGIMDINVPHYVTREEACAITPPDVAGLVRLTLKLGRRRIHSPV